MEGRLGRNAIRGFPSSQVDLGMYRTFQLGDRWRLKAGMDLFNVLNHPNFGDPSGLPASGLLGKYTPNAAFGTTQTTLGRIGNAGGGLSPIYAYGTPRDIQLALKVSF